MTFHIPERPLQPAVYIPVSKVLARIIIVVCLIVVAGLTALLRKTIKRPKQPIAIAIMCVGLASMLPMLLTEAWEVLDARYFPESISVPGFIGGAILLLLGAFIWMRLRMLGEP